MRRCSQGIVALSQLYLDIKIEIKSLSNDTELRIFFNPLRGKCPVTPTEEHK
jgi:hypothetical protein